MSFTFCTSGAIVAKAGEYADTSVTTSGGLLAQFSDEAEATINATARYDFTTNWASLDANAKPFLSRIAAALAAIDCIVYNVASFPLSRQAETQLDVLDEQAGKGLSMLKDKNVVTFLGGS